MHRASVVLSRKAGRSRRSPLALLALGLLAIVALSACGDQANTPSASSLIHDAQKAINADTAFHFKMKVDHPGTPAAGDISITAADGDVKKPDQIKGTATISMGGPAFAVQFIGIGSQQWILTPLNPDWVSADQYGIDLSKVLDPNT